MATVESGQARPRRAPRWGHGMVPESQEWRARNEAAAAQVLDYLTNPGREHGDTLRPSLSVVKGLYGRAWKHDQSDWFLAWERLGPLPGDVLREVADCLFSLNGALKRGDEEAAAMECEQARGLGVPSHLARYLGTKGPTAGLTIYLLTERGQREVLRIGTATVAPTTEDPFSKVRGLARPADGEMPMDARAAWHVVDGSVTEESLRAFLAQYRDVSDRDSYRLPLGFARRLIDGQVTGRAA